MQELDSGLLVPGSDFDFIGEADKAQREKVKLLELGELGICWDCPRVATTPCPDGVARCDDHAKAFAVSILDTARERDRFVHRLSPKAKKARAKRRAKRKAQR